MSDAESLAGRVDAIVVGASAGGVEAISALLPALRPGLPAAVFVVLHLPRDRPSLLAGIFQAKCALPVREAEDKEPATGGTVYLAPPDYHLLLDAGPQLALSADPPVNWSRPSIDVLFESAADVYRSRLLGIVLSGANDDGAAGAVAIARAGGQVLVQAPESAQSALMPESTLRRCAAARSMPLEAIARLLGTLSAKAADAGRSASLPPPPAAAR